jgi:hypothetical protein
MGGIPLRASTLVAEKGASHRLTLVLTCFTASMLYALFVMKANGAE